MRRKKGEQEYMGRKEHRRRKVLEKKEGGGGEKRGTNEKVGKREGEKEWAQEKNRDQYHQGNMEQGQCTYHLMYTENYTPIYNILYSWLFWRALKVGELV